MVMAMEMVLAMEIMMAMAMVLMVIGGVLMSICVCMWLCIAVSKCSPLKFLSLKTHTMARRILPSLLQSSPWPSLRYIDAESCFLDDSDVNVWMNDENEITNVMPNVEALNLRDNADICNSVNVFAEKFPNLRFLDVSACPSLHDISAIMDENMVFYSPHLEVLDVSQTSVAITIPKRRNNVTTSVPDAIANDGHLKLLIHNPGAAHVPPEVWVCNVQLEASNGDGDGDGNSIIAADHGVGAYGSRRPDGSDGDGDGSDGDGDGSDGDGDGDGSDGDGDASSEDLYDEDFECEYEEEPVEVDEFGCFMSCVWDISGAPPLVLFCIAERSFQDELEGASLRTMLKPNVSTADKHMLPLHIHPSAFDVFRDRNGRFLNIAHFINDS